MTNFFTTYDVYPLTDPHSTPYNETFKWLWSAPEGTAVWRVMWSSGSGLLQPGPYCAPHQLLPLSQLVTADSEPVSIAALSNWFHLIERQEAELYKLPVPPGIHELWRTAHERLEVLPADDAAPGKPPSIIVRASGVTIKTAYAYAEVRLRVEEAETLARAILHNDTAVMQALTGTPSGSGREADGDLRHYGLRAFTDTARKLLTLYVQAVGSTRIVSLPHARGVHTVLANTLLRYAAQLRTCTRETKEG